MQSTIRALFWSLVLGHLIVAGWFAARVRQELLVERHVPETSRLFTIPSGATLKDVLNRLHRQGLAPHPDLMHVAIRIWRPKTLIKSGTFRIPDHISSWDLIQLLHRGEEALFKLTLPEGLDIWETTDLLGESRWGSRAQFAPLIMDPSLISDLDPDADNLEGYLFPETYQFAAEATPEEVVSSLVGQFRRQTLELQARAQQYGFSIRDWVALASLIEKETARPDERFRISGVFHRRLDRGMLLQCDPTIIYALKRGGRYRGRIYKSDISFDSPYNTYVYSGLPPGPIASPGLPALEAALDPESHSYLYFVSRNDGSHHFSESLGEHLRAVRRYQR